MKRLTTSQKDVFITLVELRKQGDTTLQAIGDKLNMSRQSIFEHFKLIGSKGYVIKEGDKYIPTSEGINQMIEDHNTEGRIITSWNDNRKKSQEASRVDDDGTTTESITEPN
jgi:predicted transcriptional regulator|tara:strand:+ start:866 stop:1201 length:336 start_codon:yes stop_codon:yes gene_type:complete